MSKAMPTKSICTSSEVEFELRRGPWTLEEDTHLIHYITCHGEGRWNLIAKFAGLKRTGKSCRLRWLNYLKPDIKRGNLTPQEQLTILELHSKFGNRWSKIAQHLPGRTDNEIKNYWRTRVQKHAPQLKIHSNSQRFLETLRNFWMPRLLEKIEQSSSSSSSSSFSSTSTMEIKDSSTPSPQPSKLMDTPLHSNENSCSNISSSDSMIISQLPENSELPRSPVQECYYVDVTSFDMEGFSQPGMTAVGSNVNFISDCQMAGIDWINDDVVCNFWNMDDLWQFRN